MTGTSVTTKVFAILNSFVPSESRLRLTEISRRTGLPLATTHRLVHELVRCGGLEREESGSFRVGVRLWEIGSLAPVRGGLRELAIPFMEDLYEATHENIQLAVLVGLEAMILEKISGRHSVPIVTRVGGRLPLHATGVGKVLLAYAAPEVLDVVTTEDLKRHASRTIIDPDTLCTDLAAVRARGYSVTNDEMTDGAMSVGAPVYGPDQHVVAALSVVVDSRTGDPERLALPVRTAARGLSRQVGESWDRIVPDEADLGLRPREPSAG